jgi:catechol 2,3-dioxygenase-like lactoylglutathione lyase family enzyme
MRVNGRHHITAIAGPAQENLDFSAGVLGMGCSSSQSIRTPTLFVLGGETLRRQKRQRGVR